MAASHHAPAAQLARQPLRLPPGLCETARREFLPWISSGNRGQHSGSAGLATPDSPLIFAVSGIPRETE